ncbi:formylmethanofuran dehydrogenase subunit B [Methanothermococcus okinawensis]|uniref:formylmethanofuran dehydrogenase subunit B n=1 Tax=Methanothermococcus okinawensis (strain DSM 14208 / JCM 11175 / IH1) TaxID=647113 RepID=F8ANC1_METOI|nr:formylmethanofuran dehydrogenase subunit B [Methanothermococcus okinawensis]AEH06180.1 formylmethanofuran dehydrogenase subunit B [Methanothermococcus okinawensis IH1]
MKIVKNVVCPFCGTLCDDLEIMVEDGHIVGTKNACRIGNAKFMHFEGAVRYTEPLMRENKKDDFKKTDYETAIEETARLLVESKLPLIYGFSTTECHAQAYGMELAEKVRGIISNTAEVCHGPSVWALQDVGYPVCTLGEVKNRADVVIFWGSNPMHAHPRHMSRYSIFSRGFFRERGRHDRTMIVVDPRKTDTAKLADIHLQVEPHKDYELISAMRAVLKGFELEVDEVAGVPSETIYEAVDICKNAQFGQLFFSMGMTQSKGKHRNIDNAIELVIDLNAHTKFGLMPMRGHYNVNGFNQVCTWISGYPLCVDYTRGYPRYNPGDSSITDSLMREEGDIMLNIASDPGAHFPQKAVKHMAKIPLVCIDPHQTPTSELANIIIPPAIAGVEVDGTAYRMDGVPIELRKVIDAPEGVLPDSEILKMLMKKVDEMM